METGGTQPQGSLKSALAGQYEIPIRQIIRESWGRLTGFKRFFWGAFGLYILAAIGFRLVEMLIEWSIHEVPIQALTFTVFLIVLIIRTCVFTPIETGLLMLGVRRSMDQPSPPRSIFHYYSHTLELFAAIVLMTLILLTIMLIPLLASMGLERVLGEGQIYVHIALQVLCILAAIYLSVAYVFVFPLIVNKHLGPWTAMETSRKAVTKHWFKVFAMQIIMALITLLGMLALLVGLVWAIPLGTIVYGVMYRTIFGVSVEPTL